MKRLIVFALSLIISGFSVTIKAESINYLYTCSVTDFGKLTGDEQFGIICDIIKPAWKIYVSNDFDAFENCVEANWENICAGTTQSQLSSLCLDILSYKKSSKPLYAVDWAEGTFIGFDVTLSSEKLISIAHENNLPCELENAAFSLEIRKTAFWKEHTDIVLKDLLHIVKYGNWQNSFKIKRYTPSVVKISSKMDLVKCMFPDRGDIVYSDEPIVNKQGDGYSAPINDNRTSYKEELAKAIDKAVKNSNGAITKNDLLAWINDSIGKCYVRLSYGFTPTYTSDSNYHGLYQVICETLMSIYYNGDECTRINVYFPAPGNNHLSFKINAKEDYVTKWCFSLMNILYEKLNSSFVVADNLGNESTISIVTKEMQDYAYDGNVNDLHGAYFKNQSVYYPDLISNGEFYPGTGVFSPYGILNNDFSESIWYRKFGFNGERNTIQLDLSRITVGFIIPESELNKYTSFEPCLKDIVC